MSDSKSLNKPFRRLRTKTAIAIERYSRTVGPLKSNEFYAFNELQTGILTFGWEEPLLLDGSEPLAIRNAMDCYRILEGRKHSHLIKKLNPTFYKMYVSARKDSARASYLFRQISHLQIPVYYSCAEMTLVNKYFKLEGEILYHYDYHNPNTARHHENNYLPMYLTNSAILQAIWNFKFGDQPQFMYATNYKTSHYERCGQDLKALFKCFNGQLYVVIDGLGFFSLDLVSNHFPALVIHLCLLGGSRAVNAYRVALIHGGFDLEVLPDVLYTLYGAKLYTAGSRLRCTFDASEKVVYILGLLMLHSTQSQILQSDAQWEIIHAVGMLNLPELLELANIGAYEGNIVIETIVGAFLAKYVENKDAQNLVSNLETPKYSGAIYLWKKVIQYLKEQSVATRVEKNNVSFSTRTTKGKKITQMSFELPQSAFKTTNGTLLGPAKLVEGKTKPIEKPVDNKEVDNKTVREAFETAKSVPSKKNSLSELREMFARIITSMTDKIKRGESTEDEERVLDEAEKIIARITNK